MDPKQSIIISHRLHRDSKLDDREKHIDAAVRACARRNHVTHCNEFKVQYLSFKEKSKRKPNGDSETIQRRRLYTVPSTGFVLNEGNAAGGCEMKMGALNSQRDMKNIANVEVTGDNSKTFDGALSGKDENLSGAQQILDYDAVNIQVDVINKCSSACDAVSGGDSNTKAKS